MTSTLRIIAIALATLALAAPAAVARPMAEDGRPFVPQQTAPAPVADDDGPSPLVFIVPSLAVVALLGAAVNHTRTARRVVA